MPQIFQKSLGSEPAQLQLKDPNNKLKPCLAVIEGCSFNENSKKKIFLIGDSHLATLAPELTQKLIKKNYNVQVYNLGGCIYFPGFDQIEISTGKVHKYCNNKYFEKLRKKIHNSNNSLIIFGGRWPMYFDNYYISSKYFIDQSFPIKGKPSIRKYSSISGKKDLKEEFIKSILKIPKNNKIMLVYPFPEVGWNVPQKLLLAYQKF